MLTPSPTNRPKLDSVNSASSMTSTSSTGSIKDRMSAFSSGSATSAKCPVCSKTVYPADAQITLDGTKYHKACAKCADCQCQITLSNFTKVGTELLCRTHNLERFHKDNSYVGGDKFKNSTRDLSSPSDPPKKEPEQEPEKCRVIKVEEEGKVVVEVVKVVEEVAAVKIGEHIEVDGRAVEEVKAEEVTALTAHVSVYGKSIPSGSCICVKPAATYSSSKDLVSGCNTIGEADGDDLSEILAGSNLDSWTSNNGSRCPCAFTKFSAASKTGIVMEASKGAMRWGTLWSCQLKSLMSQKRELGGE